MLCTHGLRGPGFTAFTPTLTANGGSARTHPGLPGTPSPRLFHSAAAPPGKNRPKGLSLPCPAPSQGPPAWDLITRVERLQGEMKGISNTELFHTQASRLKALSIYLSSFRFFLKKVIDSPNTAQRQAETVAPFFLGRKKHRGVGWRAFLGDGCLNSN